MNKYNLIHTITGEKHLCDKVVIDGDDYYVTSANNTQTGDWVYSEDLNSIEKVKELFTCLRTEHEFNVPAAKLENFNGFVELPRCKKVIATSNPDTLIPFIFDVVQEAAEVSGIKYIMQAEDFENITEQDYVAAYKNGYYNHAKTHAFTKEDMIAFGLSLCFYDKSIIETALEKYNEQKPTTLYYE